MSALRMKLFRLICLALLLTQGQTAHAAACVAESVLTSTLSSSNISSLDFQRPPYQPGDLLLVQVVVGNSAASVSSPGWTRFSQRGLDGRGRGGVTQQLFYRVASSVEPSTYTFSWSGAARATGGLLLLRGVSLVGAAPDYVEANSADAGASVTAPSVTTVETQSRVLRFFAFGNGNNALDPPAVRHYASATTQAGPNGVVAAASSRIQIAIGASGTASATAGGASDEWVASSVALKPDPTSSGGCELVQVDHYQLSWSGSQALTCNPLDVTLRACQNADCTAFYPGAAAVTLSPAAGWSSNPLAFSGGSVALQYQLTSPGNVTLGVSGATPAPLNPLRCVVGGVEGSCEVSFADSGFIFDVPNTLAAKPTAATLRAVKKDDQTQACVPGFPAGTRSLLFSRSYSNPASGTQPVWINGTQVITNSVVSLNFDGTASAPLMVRYDDAGQIDLTASYTGSSGLENGLVMTGSDQFVSKPYGLLLQTDTAASCTAADISCPLYPGGVRAGDPFSLRIQAVAWQSDGEALTAEALADNSVTPNFQLNGIALASLVQAPVGGSNGTLGLSSYNHVLGAQTTLSNQSISEVGVFRIAATPPANAYFGETVSATVSGLVGRFAPAYLQAAGEAALTPSCGSAFSYQGQPMAFASGQDPRLTVTAFNRQGGVTGNYDRGSFWRLGLPGRDDYLSVSGRTSLDAPGRLQAQGSLAISQSGADSGDGARTWRWSGEQLLYTPATVPLADDLPFNAAIRQGFSASALTDADGACVGTGSSCQTYSYDFSGSQVRLGRLAIGNAHGSELQGLDLPLRVESWQAAVGGNAFVAEGLDSCSAALLGAPQLSGYSGNLSAGETSASLIGPLAGAGMLRLTAPGAGNDGSVRASINGIPSWLFYDWRGNGREAASGLATFGIYAGSTPLIYRRELYRTQ